MLATLAGDEVRKMLDDRKLTVLRAIVEDYVRTHEPVGSRAIVDRHSLGVSSATVRNDMAVLEEEGFIVQPHTSAGRVPTDKGYRLFVDRLSEVKPLSVGERRAIENFLSEAVDMDDVMARTVRILAQLTRQVALVQYPSLVRSSVRHVEVVGLGPRRVLLVVIADSGRVEQRIVEIADDVSDEFLARLRQQVNQATAGLRFSDIPVALADIARGFPLSQGSSVVAVVSSLLETVAERHEERIVLGGTANLARYDEVGIGPLLEALEEQMVLLRLLGEAGSPVGGALLVRIGHENAVQEMAGSSVVSAGYGRAGSLARLGIIGPTHMDYPSAIASVRAVARYLGSILNENPSR